MKRYVFATAFGFIWIAASVVLAGSPPIEGYKDPAAIRSRARSLAKSEFALYAPLARSLGGNDIGLLTIGKGKLNEKPAVLVVGGVDPTRPMDSEVVLRVAQQLIKAAETGDEVRRLLDRNTFYFIVQAAPDPVAAFCEKPRQEREMNLRPIDDDTDGQTDEDGPEDLNGDGLITVMRVEDTDGKYIVHPDDDRVMIEADVTKGEHGRYRLYAEGRDNDGDGLLNEDPPGGVSFDRNFTFDYPYFERGAGPHQVSEIETRAVADFAFDHPNIVLVWTICGRDNLLNKWEPDESAEEERIKTALLSADTPYLDKIAKAYEAIQGESKPPEVSNSKGSLVKWAYFHYGRWSIATRPWWAPETEKETENPKSSEGEGGDEKKDESDEDNRGAEDLHTLAWFEDQGVDGFVNWQPYSHPDLEGREVEIGGFRPYLKQNPPASILDDLADKQYAFLLKLGDMLPCVRLADVKAEPLGADVWRVTAAVVNEGVLPTVSEMGRLSREPQRLQVELVLPRGTSLVTGHSRRSIAPLSGDGGRAEQKWLVRNESGKVSTLRVRAWSPMVGNAEREVKLVERAK